MIFLFNGQTLLRRISREYLSWPINVYGFTRYSCIIILYIPNMKFNIYVTYYTNFPMTPKVLNIHYTRVYVWYRNNIIF